MRETQTSTSLVWGGFTAQNPPQDQEDYNAKNGIVPRTVWKEIDAPLRDMVEADYIDPAKDAIENMLRDRRKGSGERIKNSKRKFLARRAKSRKILNKIKGEIEEEIC